MKKIFTGTMTVVALAWLLAFSSACDDDDKTANPQDHIKQTWRVGSAGFVKKDGVSVTSEYIDLTVTLHADGTYTTSNAKKLFYPSGTWAWVGTGTSEFLIDGDFSVTVTALAKTSLMIKFTMHEADVNPNGRTYAIVGNYELSLEAQ
jgi:hypothetical protein